MKRDTFKRTFGEIGIVTNPLTQKIKAKLADRRKTCMFVSYAKNHASGVYKMLNRKTNRILKTRAVIWMKKQYRKYKKIDNKKIDNDDNTVMTQTQKTTTPKREEMKMIPKTEGRANKKKMFSRIHSMHHRMMYPKLMREMKQLGGWLHKSPQGRL